MKREGLTRAGKAALTGTLAAYIGDADSIALWVARNVLASAHPAQAHHIDGMATSRVLRALGFNRGGLDAYVRAANKRTPEAQAGAKPACTPNSPPAPTAVDEPAPTALNQPAPETTHA